MSNLIKDPNDPRRRLPAQTLERAQGILWSVHKLFASETLARKALRLAWEAIRVAYCAIIDETDGDHLGTYRRRSLACACISKRKAERRSS